MRPSSLLASCEAKRFADPYDGEAAEGVEGADVDGVRLVEHGRRQEGHQRLVEVQDVEAVLASRSRARSLKRQLRVTRPMLPLVGKA